MSPGAYSVLKLIWLSPGFMITGNWAGGAGGAVFLAGLGRLAVTSVHFSVVPFLAASA